MTGVPIGLQKDAISDDRTTDDQGYLADWRGGVLHVTEDEVPDNAHWKGWVW